MDQLYMYNPESHGTPVFRVKVFFCFFFLSIGEYPQCWRNVRINNITYWQCLWKRSEVGWWAPESAAQNSCLKGRTLPAVGKFIFLVVLGNFDTVSPGLQLSSQVLDT